MKKFYLLIFVFLLNLCYSQNPTAIDFTFSTADDKPIFNSEIQKTIVQSDGKILVLGSFTKYSFHGTKNFPQKNLVRLNADMTIDPTFNIGTGFTSQIKDIALQSTGKILVLLYLNSFYNGVDLSGDFVRLNSDGSLDATFLGAFNSFDGPGKLIVLSNDKVLIQSAQYISRTNANGMIDSTFAQINVPGGSIRDFIVLPTGDIIIANVTTLRKYGSNGQLPVFGQFTADNFNCFIKSLLLQPDGKILVMGGFFEYQGSEINNRMVRLNANGSLDPSFTTSAIVDEPLYAYTCLGASFNCAALQPDGKILVGGRFSNYGGVATSNLMRLNSNGTLDNSFKGNVSAEVVSISRLNNSDFIVGLKPTFIEGVQRQSFYNDLFVDTILKTNSTGTLVNANVSSQHKSEQIIILPNNQVALIGNSTSAYHRGIKLVDTNGNLVVNTNLYSGFSSQISNGYYESVKTAAKQTDGKIIVGGYFTTYNGIGKNNIVRLNIDFSIDASFNIGTGFYGSSYSQVDAIAVQPDGKVLIAGSFNSYNGTAVAGNFVRLTATGQLDPTFTSSALITKKIVIQPDGKILVLDYEGIKRLNSNGSLDATFASFPQANAMALLTNGKIIIATYNVMKKLNSDGSVDNTFTQMSFNGAVNTLLIQPDGKIILGGTFTSFSNPSATSSLLAKGLARLDSNGNFDDAFDSGTGFNNDVRAIAMQSDGKILVAGEFTRFDGAWTNGVVRLVGGDSHVLQGTVRYDNNNDGCGISDPFYSILKFRVTSGSLSSDFITNTSGSYSIPFPAGSFTVTPIFENTAYQTILPATLALNFPADGIVVNQDFCITALSIHPDLEVVIIPVTVARPGFNSTYKVIYKNKGNQVLSGTIAMNFNDAVMDYFSSNPLAIITPNNATWTFTNLLPNETRSSNIVFKINSPTQTPAVNGGDSLVFSANISSTMTDDTPADNTFTFNQVVVNSYDPNDKTCLEGSSVSTQVIGNYVHYMIRFENKGTYMAQNVTVRDIIDSAKFDINSLIPLFGSHAFITEIKGNQVDFVFENINLDFADNNNDGYVMFKIKTKSTLTQGSTFSNSASIYFDYNAPIITNSAITSITTLGIADFNSENYFTIYPNPAEYTLNISKNSEIEVKSYSIYNSIGQLIMVQLGENETQSIDISNLKIGNYFVRIFTDKGISNLRFIKK